MRFYIDEIDKVRLENSIQELIEPYISSMDEIGAVVLQHGQPRGVSVDWASCTFAYIESFISDSGARFDSDRCCFNFDKIGDKIIITVVESDKIVPLPNGDEMDYFLDIWERIKKSLPKNMVVNFIISK